MVGHKAVIEGIILLFAKDPLAVISTRDDVVKAAFTPSPGFSSHRSFRYVSLWNPVPIRHAVCRKHQNNFPPERFLTDVFDFPVASN